MGKGTPISYQQKSISNKKRFARETMCLRDYSGAELERRKELLAKIYEQIVVCEELATPLSTDMIKELCFMQNVNQILSYCHRVKTA